MEKIVNSTFFISSESIFISQICWKKGRNMLSQIHHQQMCIERIIAITQNFLVNDTIDWNKKSQLVHLMLANKA